MDNTIHLLWGKTSAGQHAYHPLLFHMLDVGNTARVLLESPNAHHWVHNFTRMAGIPPELTPSLVTFFVSLHDIGKASPSFQNRNAAGWARVLGAGFPANPNPRPGFNHGLEGYWALFSAIFPSLGLVQLTSITESRRIIDAVSLALGSHHGRFFKPGEERGNVDIEGDPTEPFEKRWIDARNSIVETLQTVFFKIGNSIPAEPKNLSAFCALLNGFTILCDWIGSDETFFRPSHEITFEKYLTVSEERARKALAIRGFLHYGSSIDAVSYTRLFPDKQPPRPLQSHLEHEAFPRLPGQMLAIVEAPMGEGKTEAALLLAERLISETDCQGFYFALPTVATSNQMFSRIKEFLEGIMDDQEVNLLLVNGRADFSKEFQAMLESLPDHHQQCGEESAMESVSQVDPWLLPRKRSLLSPYGVGTVDQAMRAVLSVRHGTLRLLGLAGKVLIIDEIHAYDTYMYTIIDRLVSWLRELGSSVILLSATLPQKKRHELVAAFRPDLEGTPTPEGTESYPLITLVPQDGEIACLKPPAVAMSREIHFSYRHDGDSERRANADYLISETRNGGCACWICNTVGEAQACYQVLQELSRQLPPDKMPELLLFHARFLLQDRQQIEETVLSRFSKNGKRPKQSILVASQVVEQSLDLDFDIMMSQLAPIDLLLQRSGRLHRHSKNDSIRPEGLKSPRMVILMPPVKEGVTDFGKSRFVYSPFILIKTLLVLGNRSAIRVPDDIRIMVDAVYDEGLPMRETASNIGLDLEPIRKAKEELERTLSAMEMEARVRLLAKPDPKGGFTRNRALETLESDGDLDEWAMGQTRLGPPSSNVILLEENNPLVTLAQSDQTFVKKDIAREYVMNSVSVSNRALLCQLKAIPVLPLFKKHPAFRGYRLIPLKNGRYWWTDEAGKGHRLEANRELGILIEEV